MVTHKTEITLYAGERYNWVNGFNEYAAFIENTKKNKKTLFKNNDIR